MYYTLNQMFMMNQLSVLIILLSHSELMRKRHVCKLKQTILAKILLVEWVYSANTFYCIHWIYALSHFNIHISLELRIEIVSTEHDDNNSSTYILLFLMLLYSIMHGMKVIDIVFKQKYPISCGKEWVVTTILVWFSNVTNSKLFFLGCVSNIVYVVEGAVPPPIRNKTEEVIHHYKVIKLFLKNIWSQFHCLGH